MAMIGEKQNLFGIKPLCMALGIARSSYYWSQQPKPRSTTGRRQPRELSVEERQQVR